MPNTTPEQKDIKDIKDDIISIRSHLKSLKDNQEINSINRESESKKLDLIYNTLTNNEFNGGNGWVTRLNNIEKMTQLHDTYWKALFTILGSSVVIGLIVKLLVK